MRSPPALEREALARGRLRLFRKTRATPDRCGNMDFFELLQWVNSLARQRNETASARLGRIAPAPCAMHKIRAVRAAARALRKMFDAVD
jgi:hypothetical protein